MFFVRLSSWCMLYIHCATSLVVLFSAFLYYISYYVIHSRIALRHNSWRWRQMKSVTRSRQPRIPPTLHTAHNIYTIAHIYTFCPFEVTPQNHDQPIIDSTPTPTTCHSSSSTLCIYSGRFCPTAIFHVTPQTHCFYFNPLDTHTHTFTLPSTCRSRLLLTEQRALHFLRRQNESRSAETHILFNICIVLRCRKTGEHSQPLKELNSL